MLIGIDGNEANIQKRVGVGRYAFEILKKFANFRIANCEWRIYLKDKPLADLPKETDWWKYKIVSPKKLWTQIGLSLALWREKLTGEAPDVFFTPSHYAPRFSPCPRVISIMDLSYLHFPEMFRKQDLYQLKNWTAYSVKKAKKILTISYSSRDDIINYYHLPPEKIVVTYPGFNMEFKNKISKIRKIKEKYKIKSEYILSVSTIQPRKNYVRLIEAFSKIAFQNEWQNLDLVIVGKKGWMWEETLRAPKRFNIEERVKFLDYVPDEDLPSLYKGAKCFVLVSLYEGFGIPILEAMSCGCPVVASNVSSLPELVGNAGILVDPYSIEEISKGITTAINRREELIKKGFIQCQRFSWKKCAQKTLEVLKEVVNV